MAPQNRRYFLSLESDDPDRKILIAAKANSILVTARNRLMRTWRPSMCVGVNLSEKEKSEWMSIGYKAYEEFDLSEETFMERFVNH
ncbi:hypothetical protein RRF57_003821 [Xylaria bambusicola]|uniref:Uncharacterized protein n=1 Tax=Xylaria bambusicola TaxID=326684 RepID=A0AAN7UME9_9PEZI